MPAADVPERAVLLRDDGLPEFVYHYTTAEGMLGILDSGQLWATDLRYLNDTSELRFGLTELLRVYEETSQAPGRRSSFSDQLAELYKVEDWQPIGQLHLSDFPKLPRERFAPVAEAVVNSLGESILIGVACFCGEPDLLSQWRGYGIGGYALGFDAHDLHRVVNSRYLPLSPVVYGKPAVRESLRGVAEHASDLIANRSSTSEHDVERQVTLPMLGMAAQMKHPTFKSEKEFRIGHVASAGSPGWKFRTSPLAVVPYLEIDLHQSSESGRVPLRSVHIAPGPEPGLRVAAVRAMLRANGYPLKGRNAVTVSASQIPFRG